MKKQMIFKRALCLGMAFTMAVYTSVMADVTIPPTQTGGQTQQVNTAGPSGAQTGTQTGTVGVSASPSRLPNVTATVTTSGAVSTGSAAVSGNLQIPVVEAQGAILYDVTHNQVLFEKNADTRFYPASITKLMTALIVLENRNLDDVVTFSEGAVTNLESGAVTLNIKAGDKLTVRDCLYGLLLKSANEVANGLAENVAGSVDAFAGLMNQRAAALGCTNTNFANPNGLNNPNHVTTPRDMALIAAAAFTNPTLCQIDAAASYNFPATASVPSVRKLTPSHKMLNASNAEYYYPGIVGGKTGYTSLAGNTLVTCAERDGTRLITVIMKSSQSHYKDTKAMLDYGFDYVKANSAGTSAGASSGATASGPAGGSGPSSTATTGGKWVQEGDKWHFAKSNGAYAKSECMIINNEYYYFDASQNMVNGWNQIDGIWYFFRPSGGLARNRWVETNNMWYYVDNNGSLFTGGTTSDGFVVDANGIWIK